MFLFSQGFCVCRFKIMVVFQVVQEYERAVIFRLGRLLSGGSKGPGESWLDKEFSHSVFSYFAKDIQFCMSTCSLKFKRNRKKIILFFRGSRKKKKKIEIFSGG